jgi:succinyl-CoA synthetase beta subunit
VLFPLKIPVGHNQYCAEWNTSGVMRFTYITPYIETEGPKNGVTPMKIHEYQAKEILRKYGVVTPKGIACFSVDEAVSAAQQLGGEVWAVKAQIYAGGRGKGGGVKVARSLDEVRQRAREILGMRLVTHQTGPEGQVVHRLFIEQGVHIEKEFYVGMVVDRGRQRVCLMASSEGGMEIEKVAAETPEKIHKVFIDPIAGTQSAASRRSCIENRHSCAKCAASGHVVARSIPGF